MTHDYSERMSLMLDRRLSAQECAELEGHLATCGECHARWTAFQQVDRALANAATFVPAPGFVNRFVTRLAQQQALQAQHARRERAIAWIGIFAAGTAALALLTIPTLTAAWFGLSDFIEIAPSLFVDAVKEIARWLVTLGALGEASRSILGTLVMSGGPILVGYGLMSALVMAAWVSVMKNMSRRWNTTRLPVPVWL